MSMPAAPQKRIASVWSRLFRPTRLASLAIAVGLILLAQYATTHGMVSKFILPVPSAVAAVLVEGFVSGFYTEHLISTVVSMLSGFAIAAVIAILIAGVFNSMPTVEEVFTPFLVAFQSLPKIALAPLIIIWFGFGETSKIVVVAASCFFPMLINTLQGLKIRDRDRLELMRSLGASKWQMFYHLRLPDALPFIFAGLHVGAIFALIGSVVAEFVGSSAGLGYAMLQAKAQFDLASVYACLFLLMLLGIALHALMVALERRVAFWVDDVSHVQT
jgi:NitT/TauT family transport system permease protein